AVLTGLIIRVWLTSPSRRLYVGMGAGIALGLLSKETDYFLIGLLVIAALLAWRSRWRPAGAIVVAVIPLLSAGWWLARNLIVYHRPLPSLDPATVTPPPTLDVVGLSDWF